MRINPFKKIKNTLSPLKTKAASLLNNVFTLPCDLRLRHMNRWTKTVQQERGRSLNSLKSISVLFLSRSGKCFLLKMSLSDITRQICFAMYCKLQFTIMQRNLFLSLTSTAKLSCSRILKSTVTQPKLGQKPRRCESNCYCISSKHWAHLCSLRTFCFWTMRVQAKRVAGWLTLMTSDSNCCQCLFWLAQDLCAV